MVKKDNFQYKEDDEVGEKTLQVISSADKLNRWMFDTIFPFCKGRILEIGSGIGNISQFFINNKLDITLSDIRPNYCNNLNEKFRTNVLCIDLVDKDFDAKFKDVFETFDTIFSLNVIEHIENDDQAIANCRKLLKKGGCLILLAPAYQNLYSNFDKELEHYRRYTCKNLSELMKNEKFNIIHKQYFNFVGMFAWFFSGKVLRKKTIPQGQMIIYNKLVPLFKLIDKLILKKAGLSTIVVGQKK